MKSPFFNFDSCDPSEKIFHLDFQTYADVKVFSLENKFNGKRVETDIYKTVGN